MNVKINTSKAFELQKANVNSMIDGTKENFIKAVYDEFQRQGIRGDELFEKAKQAFSGGSWVTIDGRHVYIKDGKVAAGTVYGKDGKKVEDMKSGGSGGGEKKPAPKKEEKKKSYEDLKSGDTLKDNNGKEWKLDTKKANGNWSITSKSGNSEETRIISPNSYKDFKAAMDDQSAEQTFGRVNAKHGGDLERETPKKESKEEAIKKEKGIRKELDSIFDTLKEYGIDDTLWEEDNTLTLSKVVEGQWSKVTSSSKFLSDKEKELVSKYEKLEKEQGRLLDIIDGTNFSKEKTAPKKEEKKEPAKDKSIEEQKKDIVRRLKGSDPKDKTPEALKKLKQDLKDLGEKARKEKEGKK